MIAAAALLAWTAAAAGVGGAGSAPAARTQVLVLDLDAIDIDKSKVSILNGRIASLLSARSDVEAITAADIQQMATLNANKAAVGCEESSCLAEIANALGARYVVYGRVGKLDDVFLLQVNLFDATIGKPISRQESQAAKLQELSAQMPQVIGALLRPLGGAQPNEAAVVEQGPPLSPLVWAGAGVGGAGAIAGVALGAWALALNGDLESTKATFDQKKFAYDNGLFVAGGAIGGAVLAAAGAVLLGIGVAGAP